MTDQASNPFAAPTARLQDPVNGASGQLRQEPRSISVSDALGWLGTGWEMFRAVPGVWIAIIVVNFLISIMMAFVPFLGPVVNGVLNPVFTGGVMVACENQRAGTGPVFQDLFEGFKRQFGNLALIGLVILGAWMVMAFVGVAAVVPWFMFSAADGAGGLGAGSAGFSGGALLTAGVVLIVILMLAIPLGIAVLWSPALVVLNGVPTLAAMRMSLKGGVRNLLPLIVFGLVSLLLGILGAIPLGLGLLVVAPMLLIACWAGYRQVFIE